MHSPLLFDIARHVAGDVKYWDISVKGMGQGSYC